MNNKYLSITPRQERFGLEDSYIVEYKGTFIIIVLQLNIKI